MTPNWTSINHDDPDLVEKTRAKMAHIGRDINNAAGEATKCLQKQSVLNVL